MPPAVPQNQPPVPRTQVAYLAGDGGAGKPAMLSVTSDSPMITSLNFVDWHTPSAPAATTAPLSQLSGVLALATRRPEDGELTALHARALLTSELEESFLSAIAHALDRCGAFDRIYENCKIWSAAIPGLLATMASDHPVHFGGLRLTDAAFIDTDAIGRNPPAELDMIRSLSVGQLVAADAHCADLEYRASSLSATIILLGSKDDGEERKDPRSDVRIVAERIELLLRHRMHVTAGAKPSPAARAQEYCLLVADPPLPSYLGCRGIAPLQALEDIKATFDFHRGTPAEARAVEQARFLSVKDAFPNVGAIVNQFTSGHDAWQHIGMLSSALLPAAAGTLPMQAKLNLLEAKLCVSSWRDFVKHLVDADANIAGTQLVSHIIEHQNDFASASVGGGVSATMAGGTPAGNGDFSVPSSYGSVRENSLADALRQRGAQDALDEAQTQTGLERVQTMMLSGATILVRAILLQEPWLQNKASALSFCSFEEPSIRPYIASVLTEDKITGTVPDLLKRFVYTTSEFNTFRSGKWSRLTYCNRPTGQFEIEFLRSGNAFKNITAKEQFIVESAFRYVREYGRRLFFGGGLDFNPIRGISFTDLCDRHSELLIFAYSLPPVEKAEWLQFLCDEFVAALDLAGELYFAKLRSARPERPEAVISEFLPLENPYTTNTSARMSSAAPLVTLRSAFPTLMGSVETSLPGTSGASSSSGGAVDKDKNKNKNKHKAKVDNGAPSAPGCKSGYCSVISDTEFFHSGVVFFTDKIKAKYKKDMCLAVCLSKKKGDAALELCPDFAAHGDMNKACHQRPKGFDLNYIYQHFTRKATKDELAAANWSPIKRSKGGSI